MLEIEPGTFQISVTREDIKRAYITSRRRKLKAERLGQRYSWECSCPISQAFQREFNQLAETDVSGRVCSLKNKKEYKATDPVMMRKPDIIRAFDTKVMLGTGYKDLNPCTIILKELS